MNFCVVLLKAQKDDDCKTEDSFAKVLESNGIKVISVPVLSFNFINDLSLYDRLVNKHDEYSGIILTSQRAMEAIEKCLQAKDLSSDISKIWNTKMTFVVGPACYKEALKLGFNPEGSDCNMAEQLAQYIISVITPGSLPLLFPCSNLKRDSLPAILSKHNVSYECLTVYETVANPILAEKLQGFLSNSMQNFSTTVIVFFSPSGVQFALPVVKPFLNGGLKLVAIGPTTADAMKNAGLCVDGVCSTPSPAGLLGILKTFQLSE